MKIEPGVRFGSLIVESVLGRGGMGIVFRARDERLGRTVAVKVASGQLLASPLERARFEREARAAAAVQHPHVAQVHTYGIEAGLPYLVLEYIDGGSLADRLQREGRLEAIEAARLGAEVARGLEAVHGLGIIHRDLKPANVLVDATGRAKLTDFGLALQASDQSVSRLTATGEIVGTPATVSPEQVLGDPVTARSDLYSLGATLFLLVTGEPPFSGASVEVYMKHARELPRSPASLVAGLPGPLVELILALLAKRPEDRPSTATEVARRLEAIVASGTGSAKALKTSPGARRALIALGPALIAVVMLVALGRRPGAEPPPEKEPERGAPDSRTPAVRPGPSPRSSSVPRVPLPDFARPLGYSVSIELLAALGQPRPKGESLENAEIRSFALSPDGSKAVAGHIGGSVVLWDLERGVTLESVAIAEGHAVNGLAFTPDARSIFVTSNGGTNWLWSPGQTPRQVPAPPLVQHTACMLDDGTVAMADLRGNLSLLDLSKEPSLRTFRTEVNTYSIRQAGRRLLLAGQSGNVVVFDLGSHVSGKIAKVHQGDVPGLAVSRDGRRFVTGGADGSLLLWDVASFGPESEPVFLRSASIDVVAFDAVTFLDELVVSCAHNGAIGLWDTERARTMEEVDLGRVGDRGSAIMARGNGSEFLVASARGVIYRFVFRRH